MSEPIGRKRWAIVEATFSPGPTAPSPRFTSHETACILNASEEEAHVEITVCFSHREPVSLFAHSSVRGHERLNARLTSASSPAPAPAWHGSAPPKAGGLRPMYPR
jgi:hypothetical protein